MAYKLVIEDKVGIKVEGKRVDENGTEKQFKFTLYCDRRNQEQMKESLNDRSETPVDFMTKVARDWSGQNLVVDEEGKSAPFSPESFALLMSIAGMGPLCYHSYIQQVGATAKN